MVDTFYDGSDAVEGAGGHKPVVTNEQLKNVHEVLSTSGCGDSPSDGGCFVSGDAGVLKRFFYILGRNQRDSVQVLCAELLPEHQLLLSPGSNDTFLELKAVCLVDLIHKAGVHALPL